MISIVVIISVQVSKFDPFFTSKWAGQEEEIVDEQSTLRRYNTKEIDEAVWAHGFHKASKLHHAALI